MSEILDWVQCEGAFQRSRAWSENTSVDRYGLTDEKLMLPNEET